MIKLSTNQEIAAHLFAISNLTMNTFKRRSFYRASNSIRKIDEPIRNYSDEKLLEIPGVGDSIKDIIKEFIRTGTSGRLEGLLKLSNHNFDENVFTTDQISRLVTAKVFNVDQLIGRIKKNKFDDLEITKVVGYHSRDSVVPAVQMLSDFLKSMSSVTRFEIAGSYRRGNAFIKDIDVVVSTSSSELLMKQILETPYQVTRINNGEKRVRVNVMGIVEADLIVCPDEEFASTLLYATGSKELNIHMRAVAKDSGYSLSQSGLFDNKAQTLIQFSDESEIFEKLGLTYLEPKDR